MGSASTWWRLQTYWFIRRAKRYLLDNQQIRRRQLDQGYPWNYQPPVSWLDNPTREVLHNFKQMNHSESTVIVQARTRKTGLRDYLSNIGVVESPACPCGYRRQTIQHTLLDCRGFNILRKEMWAETGKVDLTRLLGTPALAAIVSESLLLPASWIRFIRLDKL